jgi:S1-C subfamily serine protease
MAFQGRCPSCGVRFQALDRLAGRRCKCPKCAGEVDVPRRTIPMPPVIPPPLPTEPRALREEDEIPCTRRWLSTSKGKAVAAVVLLVAIVSMTGYFVGHPLRRSSPSPESVASAPKPSGSSENTQVVYPSMREACDQSPRSKASAALATPSGTLGGNIRYADLSCGVANVRHTPSVAVDPTSLFAICRSAVTTIIAVDNDGEIAAQGSGFCIDPKLVKSSYNHFELNQWFEKHPEALGTAFCNHVYVLTNYHVIKSAARAEVRLDDGRVAHVLEVVAEKEQSDLALVMARVLSSNISKPIGKLRITEEPELAIGARVYAIGTPKGLEASLSEGIVSGKREITAGISWLQTTAPISPGSSGGPLLDTSGKVVGVVTANRLGGQNLNFAIPAAQVRAFLKGRCNSREIWRGTGIKEEEDDAFLNLAVVALRPDAPAALRMLQTARAQMHNRHDWRESSETLAKIVPAELGEFEYLFHYTKAVVAVNESRHLHLKDVHDNGDESARIAKASFRKTIELNANFSPAYQFLASCMDNPAELREALIYATQLVKLVPRCGPAYRLRGQLLLHSKRNLEAYTDLRTAVELTPNNSFAYMLIGQVCLELGEKSEAVDAFSEFLRRAADDSRLAVSRSTSRYLMGLAYERMSKYELAIASFQAAIESPQCPNVTVERCRGEVAKCRQQLDQ